MDNLAMTQVSTHFLSLKLCLNKLISNMRTFLSKGLVYIFSFQFQTKKESISQNDKGTANGLVDEFQPKLTKWQRFRSIFSNFKINLVLPTLTWLFYHLDILSDILQMHTLQANCHYIFFGCSIAILVVSFMVTVFYVKYHFNNSWCEAFFYVRTFE